jgi:hypothetical protein
MFFSEIRQKVAQLSSEWGTLDEHYDKFNDYLLSFFESGLADVILLRQKR